MQIVLQFTAFLLPVSAHESKVSWLFLHAVFGYIPEVC